MRFKRLQLLGFKSFAESTELVFEPGVTAIVGPNGCGKSNIADAIKWVLGEQSARELRGGRMEDVIFNGSGRRDPTHIAEVALTLDNTDHSLPIEYAEVTIARRLFRSGESEYLLNKTPVRLKDITQLLMGTGIGTSAYSLFEQGRIEQIISARPEERRVVFEEAAGITKYKSQKREALRKLEQTEENLARVNDVIGEVKRQINSMERQVRRAKAYQEQFEQLKQMEVRLARGEVQSLAVEWKEKESGFETVQKEIEELEQKSQDRESHLTQAREKVTQASQAFAQAREALLNVIHTRETAQSNLQINRERITESESRKAKVEEEISVAQTHLDTLEQQHAQLAGTIEAQSQEREAKEETMTQAEAGLADCSQLIEAAQAAIQKARADLLEVTSEEVQIKNALSKVRQEVTRFEARVSRLQMEEAKVAAEQTEAAAQVQDLQGNLTQARDGVSSLETNRATLDESLAKSASRFEQLQQEVIGLEQQTTRLASQHEMLKGLLESHEGYSSGVKGLLTALDEGRLPREGVAGVLAEMIQVNSGEMAPVDAALGPWAEAIVVESAPVAERCRRFLEETQAGRVLFLILDRIPPKTALDPAALLPGAESLIERIGVTPHLEELLKLLIGETWLISNRDSALAMMDHMVTLASRGSAAQFSTVRLVTPQGEMFTVAGALLGCAPNEEGLIIGRMSRLKSLEVAWGSAESRLEQAKGQLKEVVDERDQVTQQISVIDRELQEQHKALERIQATFQSAQSVLEKLEQEQQVVATEKNEVETELEEARARFKEQDDLFTEKTQALEALDASIEQKQEEIAQALERREKISVELAEAKAQLRSFDELVSSRTSSLQVMEQSIQSARNQMQARREELERLSIRRLECESATTDLEGSLENLEQTRAQSQTQADQMETQHKEALEQAQAQEQQFLSVSRRLEQLQSRVHAQEMERAQITFKQEQVSNRLEQIYQIRLEEETVEGASAEEMEGLRSEVETLAEKLKRMGPVNLASIDEERELQNRHEYLTSQQADLEKAKEDLHSAITKINRTTRMMFRETFEAIQKEFKVCYKQLFGGGEARLVLLDEQDVLESGVEIIARPPGKQLQAISLLSGGEKALTSIALLFAIFRIKPSPFCLLDEIDAPLDESNVTRFASALRDFLDQSQFIVITHNKKTISMADIMYGVTMEERGVSKLVSVKLNGNGNGNGHGAANGNGHKVSVSAKKSVSA